MPVNTPVDGSIEPTAGLLLLQEPPAVVSVSVIMLPEQTDVGPSIGPTTAKALHESRKAINVKARFFISFGFSVHA
jgi:hypothetical protein